jgi:GNAT superfamily N-acetyltransferase
MGSVHEWTRDDGYVLSDDPARLDRDALHAFLCKEAYWSLGRPRAVVERAIDHSLCLGAYAADGAQAGFARVVTDRATFAWLCDVLVLAPHRGRGLGVWVVETALAHPELAGVGRWWLATLDAQGLYERFGFGPQTDPGRLMVRSGGN